MFPCLTLINACSHVKADTSKSTLTFDGFGLEDIVLQQQESKRTRISVLYIQLYNAVPLILIQNAEINDGETCAGRDHGYSTGKQL